MLSYLKTMYGALPLRRDSAETDEFDLRYLPADLLEGVLQRVGAESKKQAESVDSGFAAVARRRAWRHRAFQPIRIDFALAEPSLMLIGPLQVWRGHAADACRFLLKRARKITQVSFAADPTWDLQLDGLKREQARAILIELAACGRVELHSLLFNRTAGEFFGGSSELVALLEHHSASLQEMALVFGGSHPEAAVYSALWLCPRLDKLTILKTSSAYWPMGLQLLLSDLHLSSLTIAADAPRFADELARALPSAPTLRQLRLNNHAFRVVGGVHWGCLANVRLLECHVHTLTYINASEAGRLLNTLPQLQALILQPSDILGSDWRRAEEEPGKWDRLICSWVQAFFDVKGDRSLKVQLPLRTNGLGRSLPPQWQPREVFGHFPDLTVERYAAGGSLQSSELPILPREFTYGKDCEVFVATSSDEARRLTIAVW